jgi:hypothetical protein
VSGGKEKRSRFADWTVLVQPGDNHVTVRQARYRHYGGGGYVFTDRQGPCADFPPGTVLNVIRSDPEEPAGDPAARKP